MFLPKTCQCFLSMSAFSPSKFTLLQTWTFLGFLVCKMGEMSSSEYTVWWPSLEIPGITCVIMIDVLFDRNIFNPVNACNIHWWTTSLFQFTVLKRMSKKIRVKPNTVSFSNLPVLPTYCNVTLIPMFSNQYFSSRKCCFPQLITHNPEGTNC